MCLALPAEVVAMGDAPDTATVSLAGVRKTISTALLDAVEIGDFVLVHVGYALHRISPEEAQRTLALMAEAGVLEEELEEIRA